MPDTASSTPITLARLLEITTESGASDLHLNAGEHPWVRVHGRLLPIRQLPVLSVSEMEAIVRSVLTPVQWERLQGQRSVDAGTGVTVNGDLIRFRLNAFFERGRLALAVRVLPSMNLSFRDLHLHPTLADLSAHRHGLVVVAGPTGCGKTTTLAAFIHALAAQREGHIITIEDPVEYHHASAACLVQQREVGSDVPSFAAGVRDALREDPNILLIGEMRDVETMSQAITAAETGHLVFTTLHTGSALETVSRILGVYSGQDGAAVRMQLAVGLRAVVAQRLLPRADGKGRVPVVEVLQVTQAVSHMLRTGRDEQIVSAIEAGGRHGMVTFEESAGRLVALGLLKMSDAALAVADEKSLIHWVEHWRTMEKK